MIQQFMDDGLIAPGTISTKSITEIDPDELKRYTQCHFFAGIAGWTFALQLANWPADRPVWTGSCPCQPFSSAGRQTGKDDERHLWPVMQRLISIARPSVFYGEQVSSAIAHGWLDDVYQGLEAEGYAVGSAVLPACSVGAPHKRDRLWFVAHSQSEQNKREGQAGFQSLSSQSSRKSGDVADTESSGSSRQGIVGRPLHPTATENRQVYRIDDAGAGCWENGEWIACPDGKQRLVECRFSSLAYGVQSNNIELDENGNDKIQKEKIDADAKKTGDTKALSALRENNDPKAHERSPRGFEGIPETEPLQPFMRQQQDGYKNRCVSPASQKAPSGEMSFLPVNGKSPCPPHGSQPQEQRSREFADVMRFMSLEASLGERRSSEAERILPVQDMYLAFSQAGLLPETLSEVQEIWRSIAIKKREQIVWNILGKRSFFWEPKPLLAVGQLNRRPILHAYGNAILPQVAAKFIEASM